MVGLGLEGSGDGFHTCPHRLPDEDLFGIPKTSLRASISRAPPGANLAVQGFSV